MRSLLTLLLLLGSFSPALARTIQPRMRCGLRGPGCFCGHYYRPVCGTNGVTYRNYCLASRDGVGVAYYGACASYWYPCRCGYDYSPVCGSNGRTYRNACQARCAGVAISRWGRCWYPQTWQSCPSGCSRTHYGVCQCRVR